MEERRCSFQLVQTQRRKKGSKERRGGEENPSVSPSVLPSTFFFHLWQPGNIRSVKEEKQELIIGVQPPWRRRGSSASARPGPGGRPAEGEALEGRRRRRIQRGGLLLKQDGVAAPRGVTLAASKRS